MSEDTINETKKDDDRILVVLDHSEDPKSVSKFRKWLSAIIVSFSAISITMCSSCWALVQPSIMEEMNISEEVSDLGLTFFVFGISIGPIFLSPISEYNGRKIVFTSCFLISIAFQFLTAFSHNIGGMLFGRFMAGFFGSVFLAVAGGTISDLFEKKDLGLPLSLFSLAPFLGPALGPLESGFVAEAPINYRWTFYIIIIFSGLLFALVILFVPETYVPFLLKRKAAKLRKEYDDNRYFAPLDENPIPLWRLITLSCKKPIMLLIRDPMMLSLCIYTGLVLAILYLFFEAIPYIMFHVYKFSPNQQGMSFIGLLIGLIIASPTAFFSEAVYLKLTERNGSVSAPEFRFPPMMLGACIIPTGLIIMAWTSFSYIHWIGVIIGSSIFGIGVMLVFYGIVTYTVEGYRLFAASALGANAFVRALMAGVFPLFSDQMYSALGVHWATMLLAFLSMAMAPLPFIFYKKGAYLRSRSPYAWSDDYSEFGEQ